MGTWVYVSSSPHASFWALALPVPTLEVPSHLVNSSSQHSSTTRSCCWGAHWTASKPHPTLENPENPKPVFIVRFNPLEGCSWHLNGNGGKPQKTSNSWSTSEKSSNIETNHLNYRPWKTHHCCGISMAARCCFAGKWDFQYTIQFAGLIKSILSICMSLSLRFHRIQQDLDGKAYCESGLLWHGLFSSESILYFHSLCHFFSFVVVGTSLRVSHQQWLVGGRSSGWIEADPQGIHECFSGR